MCGIFVAINSKNTFGSSELEVFRSANRLINYRGPDASAEAIFRDGKEEAGDSFNVYLGHNRLAIIDLSSEGNQPMHIGDMVIVFNGEIFNYIEIRKELQDQGVDFKTATDTEVIIQTYQKYGETGFAKFNGMWAFVLYDIKKNKVIVSKDRFSIKPLYYLKREGKLFFASEIKQLLLLTATTVVNESKILSFIQQSLLNQDEQTFYQDIFKVPAKSNWTIHLENGKIDQEKYWDYSLKEYSYNEEEAIEQFLELFQKSIELRLRGDVKVGSLLSGGLDSSAITMVANTYDPTFKSFSVAFDDVRYSEERHINTLVSATGIHNSTYKFSAAEVLAGTDRTMFHQEQPFVSFSVVCQFLLFEKIKKDTNIVCLLCGQGADEILMGYLKYYYFVLKDDFKKGHLGNLAGNIIGSLVNGTALRQFNLPYAKRYIPFLNSRKQSYLLREAELLNIGSTPDLRSRQIADIDRYSVPILNHYEDRNSMANSLEVRLPFLDHKLVEFCVNLPNSLKMKNGWTKYTLRKAMRELPPEIAWRKDKQGFVTPEKEWLKKEMRSGIIQTLKSSILHELNIIDKSVFLQEYEKFAAGAKSTISYEEIERVYITELWLKSIKL